MEVLNVQEHQSLYKYMKLTDNTELVKNYNKTMIALQKQGIGVNQQLLDETIKGNTDVNDVLALAGVDIGKYNQEKERKTESHNYIG